MSLIRPLTRELVQPLMRPLIGRNLGGDALTPAVKALFASGEKGVMFDFTRASNLYTDSARTTLVSASGDGIGNATDLSPNAKHASSTGSARPTWNSAGYATFDAFDDYLQTAAIDFSGTDKMTVVLACEFSAAATGVVVELGASTALAGVFSYISNLGAPNYYVGGTTRYGEGTTGGAIPFKHVPAMLLDIAQSSGAQELTPRLNGATASPRSVVSGTTAGTGNFGNHALFLGARNAASLFFNGRIYRLLVIGRALTTTERNTAERWAAQPVGIIIP